MWSAPIPVLRTPPDWLSVALGSGEMHWVLQSECSGEEPVVGLIPPPLPPPRTSGIWLLGVKEAPWKRVLTCCLVAGCLRSAGLTTGA